MLRASGTRKGRATAKTAAALSRRARLVGAIVTAVALAGIPSLAYAATASAALGQDLSATLPVVNVNEAPGDFLNEGHDQVASALPPNLEIRENEKFGSGAVQDTPTDLRTLPNDQFQYPQGNDVPWWSSTDYRDVGAQWPLTSVKVAASASNIYMAGATWDDNAPAPDQTYQLHLYKLPHDGSCASAGCAEKTLNLPSCFACDSFFSRRVVVATSLAVGVVGGRTLIAVGLSDFGISIFDEDLNPVANIQDMAVPDGEPGAGGQTPINALAFGPPTGPGQGGLLTAGVVSPWVTLYSWRLDSHGNETHMSREGGFGGVDANYATAAAVAQINGHQWSVFGTVGGDLFVLDPDTPGSGLTQIGGLPAAVTGVTAVRSWDDDPGNQHLVVGLEDGTAEVLRYVGGTLQPIPLGPNGEKRVSWEQVRTWFPGYGAGRLQVANDTVGDVSVSMASSTDPQRGCWFNTSVDAGPAAGLAPPLSPWPAVPAFPTQATTVAAGQSSPAYFIGALTAGVDGSCAAAQAQEQGERAAYVVITPDGDAADQRLVKLRVDQSGKVLVDQQVGGDLNVALERTGGGGSWGGWRLRVTGPDDPKATAAPVVGGQRLTSAPGPDYKPPVVPVADDPARPVYRFDATGARWEGLGASGQVTARLPAMTAEGTVDGEHWEALGQLMPVTVPTLSSDGTSVTLGEASFFWQDAPGATPLSAVRVVSGGQASEPVRLAGLAVPPLDSSLPVPLATLKVVPTEGGVAVPRANGVDQAPLAVALSSDSAGTIANNDPRYGLVYYRDADTLSLITGLYTPGQYSDYVSVGPCRGAYPNDTLGRGLARKRRGGPGGPAAGGLGRGRARKRRGGPGGRAGGPVGCPGSSAQRNYLVTTSAGTQSLVGVINDSGTATGPHVSSDITVAARANRLSASGTATGAGVSVTGCGATQGICTLVDPTAGPALYQAGNSTDGPATGLQFTAAAVTSTESLPLVVGGGDVHALGAAPLNVTPTQAKLQTTPPFLSTDLVDTALVSSGELVSATVPVVGAGAGRGRPRPR
jgi:hypothetical protein